MMGKPLEQQYNWKDLAELTAKRIEEANFLTKFNKKNFVDWFMQREKIGYIIDWRLIARAYKIWNDLNNEADSFTVVEGPEGSGKSTLAIQFGAWISPTMDLHSVCYTMQQFIRRMHIIAQTYEDNKLKKLAQSVINDEGVLQTFSRDAMKRDNKILGKTFMVQRFLNVNVVICIPKFKYLDSIIRDHRVRTLITIKRRGKYKCIVGKGIKACNDQLTKAGDVGLCKIPYGFFWEGDFSKRFPSTITKESYEATKFDNIKSFLAEAQDEAATTKMVRITKASEELGVHVETLKKYIRSGDIEGKKMMNSWFITRKSYEKLLNPKEKGF